MRVASLDLGTNTFLCLICRIENGTVVEVYEDLCEVVRLGEGVNASRCFTPGALQRANQTLKRFQERILHWQVDKVSAVATSAARDVTNKEDLFKITEQLGIPLDIISGRQEAALTFWGGLAGFIWPPEDVVVIDVGGGSTEVIAKEPQKGIVGHSFNIGSVRLQELFLREQPPKVAAFQECEAFIHQVLAEQKEIFKTNSSKVAVAVAGTPTTLAALAQGKDFEESTIDGFSLSVDLLCYWESRFREMTLEEIKCLPGMQAKRADVILAGTLILRVIAECLDIREYIVSTRGVRYGLAQTMV